MLPESPAIVGDDQSHCDTLEGNDVKEIARRCSRKSMAAIYLLRLCLLGLDFSQSEPVRRYRPRGSCEHIPHAAPPIPLPAGQTPSPSLPDVSRIRSQPCPHLLQEIRFRQARACRSHRCTCSSGPRSKRFAFHRLAFAQVGAPADSSRANVKLTIFIPPYGQETSVQQVPSPRSSIHIAQVGESQSDRRRTPRRRASPSWIAENATALSVRAASALPRRTDPRRMDRLVEGNGPDPR